MKRLTKSQYEAIAASIRFQMEAQEREANRWPEGSEAYKHTKSMMTGWRSCASTLASLFGRSDSEFQHLRFLYECGQYFGIDKEYKAEMEAELAELQTN